MKLKSVEAGSGKVTLKSEGGVSNLKESANYNITQPVMESFYLDLTLKIKTMKDLTSFEIRLLEHVKKQKTVALTEDLFDFDGFEKNEFSKIQNTLEELVYKREINRGRTPNNYTVY